VLYVFFCGEGDAGERPCLRKEFVQAGWYVPSENAALSAQKIYFGWRLMGVDWVYSMFFCEEIFVSAFFSGRKKILGEPRLPVVQ